MSQRSRHGFGLFFLTRQTQEKALPHRSSTQSTRPSREPDRRGPIRLLVVDSDSGVGQQVTLSLAKSNVKLVQVGQVSEAFEILNRQAMDLVMIDADMPDGSGLAMAKRLRRGYANTQTILMSHHPNVQDVIQAIRIGAGDLILKPLDPDEVRQRVDQAVKRLLADRYQRRRIRRLKRMCKELSQARDEIANQVDILCNDLVTAYQDLAEQVNVLGQTSEYTTLIRQELDLETLLRRTLEYMLQKVGPTNGAIFLPASTDPDEFSLGGYVNYECASESAEILLQHLADVLAPKMVEHKWSVHVTDNQVLTQWLGDTFSYLTDNHLLAFPCRHEGDTLSVVVLFRHKSQPYNGSMIRACTSIAPLLAQSLAKVVSIHHRLLTDEDDESLPMD